MHPDAGDTLDALRYLGGLRSGKSAFMLDRLLRWGKENPGRCAAIVSSHGTMRVHFSDEGEPMVTKRKTRTPKQPDVSKLDRRQLYNDLIAMQTKLAQTQRELQAAVADRDENTERWRRSFDHERERVNAAQYALDKIHAMPVPTQRRRVVRTLVIEGDPVWVATTLSKSLPDGITALDPQPGGLPKHTITATTDSDVTTRMDVRNDGRQRQPEYRSTGDYHSARAEREGITREEAKARNYGQVMGGEPINQKRD